MSAETFEAGYIGATPSRIGSGNWGGVWRLQQQVDRLINDEWPRPFAIDTITHTIQSETLTKGGGNLWFSTDGKYFYIHKGSAGFGEVYQYECQTAWNVSSIKHIATTVLTLTNTTNINFKDDGTKFYILSTTDDRIHQHSCATAWDINTATYDNVSFSVGTQESTPSALFFRPDGTRFYIAGANRIIYQYSCSTAWNLSTASYSSISLNVTATLSGSLSSIQFAADGTSLFAAGTGTSNIYKYNLSTAWTLTGATLPADSILAGPITNPYLFFKPDGLTLFASGSPGTQDWISVYRLKSAYTIDRRVYTGQRVDLNTYTPPASSVTGSSLRFNADGTKFFLMHYNDQYDISIHQYTAAQPWTTQNAVYDPFTFDISSQESTVTGIAFKSDGTKFYIIGTTNDRIYQYSCSTAWDVTTASYDNKSFLVSSQESNPNAVFFKDDGTKFYVIGTTTDTVYQYSCATAWDVSTGSYDSKSVSIAAKEATATDLYIKSDGTKFYIVGSTSDSVHEYALSTAWDVSTATFTASLTITTADNTSQSIFFSSDGTKLYVVGTTNSTVRVYTLSTAWDITTGTIQATSNGVYDLAFMNGPNSNNCNGMTFSSDGTKIYCVSSDLDIVYQGNLSTAWDIASATIGLTSSFRAKEAIEASSFVFKEDGTKLYISNIFNSVTYQYSLSTAWDVSTASYDSKSYDFGTDNTLDLFFKNDGLTLYRLRSAGYLYQYALSTAWDISTASFEEQSILLEDVNTNPYLNSPRSVFISNDGKFIYIYDNSTLASADIYKYEMTVPWNIATAAYVQKGSSAINQARSRMNIAFTWVSFKPDGTRAYGGTGTTGSYRGIIEFEIGNL